MADPTVNAFEARTLFTIVRRRAWLIALIVGGAALVAALLSSTRADEYRATTEILIVSPTSAIELSDEARENAIRIIESDLVSNEVDQRLGYDTTVSAGAVSGSDVIAVTGINGDPQRAAETANTYAEVYLDQRRERQIEDLEQRRTELQDSYDQVSLDLEELTAPISDLDAQIAVSTTDAQVTALAEQRDRLVDDISAQRQALVFQQAAFAQQLNDLQLARASVATTSGEILSEAVPPASPASPVPERDGLAAAVVAAVFAIGLAVLLERLDDTVKDIDHVRSLTDVPVLGTVPEADRAGGLVFASGRSGNKEASESFRQIRTGLDFLGVPHSVRSIMITSAVPQEGKTTVAVNLASAEASAGRRVLLVEADLRRPVIANRLKFKRQVGLSGVLAGTTQKATSFERVDKSNLFVLTAGRRPPNPAELLGGGRLDSVVSQAMDEFDLVIVDSPPVLPVTDARIIATAVDAALVVVARRSSKVSDFTDALAALQLTDTPVIGTILNKGDMIGSYYGELV